MPAWASALRHGMDPAALPGRVHQLGDGGLNALVGDFAGVMNFVIFPMFFASSALSELLFDNGHDARPAGGGLFNLGRGNKRS